MAEPDQENDKGDKQDSGGDSSLEHGPIVAGLEQLEAFSFNRGSVCPGQASALGFQRDMRLQLLYLALFGLA